MEHPYLLTNLLEFTHNESLIRFVHGYTHVIYSWIVMLFLIIVGFLATRNLTMVPGKLQNLFEMVISGMESFMVDITGEEGRWLFPLCATVFLYVLICNLMGLIPGFMPPTSIVNTPLSIALVVVVFTHVLGIKYHGPKYIKHFLGPVWWLAPLIFIIEVIGHLARVVSLTYRLFGNMMGHEVVLGILFMLVGAVLLPLPIMVMGIFVSLVQAFVFFLLSIMYFTGSIEHAH